MATTNYGTNNPLAVKLWSKMLSVEALKATWIYRFIGDGTNWWDADERDDEDSEADPDFGPEAYKSHAPGCQCWDCQGAREEAAKAAGEKEN